MLNQANNGEIVVKLETRNLEFEKIEMLKDTEMEDDGQVEEGVNRDDFFDGMNQIEGEVSKCCVEGDLDLVILEVKDPNDIKKTFYVPKDFYELLKEH